MIRVGLVGCGDVAVHHLRHIARIAGAEIVGVADVDQARARAMAGKIAVYPSLAALIEGAKPDIVHITTPPATHAPLAQEALKRGVHVFVEKPLGLSLAEADAIARAAKDAGKLFCPDYINLFHPGVLRILDLAGSGALGTIRRVSATLTIERGGCGVSDAAPNSWKLNLPGGPLHNYICHPLYMVLSLSGPARGLSVTPRSNGFFGEGITDGFDVTIDGAQCTGAFRLAITEAQPIYTFRIEGDRGAAEMDFVSQIAIVSRSSGLPGIVQRVLGPFNRAGQLAGGATGFVFGVLTGRVKAYGGLAELLPRLYAATEGKRANPIPPALPLEVSRVTEQIFAAAGKLHPDEPPAPDESARSGPRALVTGATGYLGKEIVRTLIAAGYRVRALARPYSRNSALIAMGAQVMLGDVRDRASVQRACEGVEMIVHAAAALSGPRETMIATDVDGTRNIAEAAAQSGVKRVVYVSSVSVYDVVANAPGTRLTAASPLEADAAQRGGASEAKRLAEDVALAETAKPQSVWTILRPGLIFGRGRNPAGLFGRKLGRFTLLFGDGASPVRFVHCSDVASAILATLKSDAAKGRVFNLAHPDAIDTATALKAADARAWALPIPHALFQAAISTANGLFKLLSSARHISDRRVAYAYWNVALDNEDFASVTGWKPGAELRAQLKEAAAEQSGPRLDADALIARAWL